MNQRQDNAMEQLVDWYRAEYLRRTEALQPGHEGPPADIAWALPEYRVSWTEVLHQAEQLNIEMSVVDLRLMFDKIRMKKRKRK